LPKQPASVLPLTCDITKTEDRNRAVDAALKQFGRIDILVNKSEGALWSRGETGRDKDGNVI
jgi:NAD(P)-dependent dehydrogenase (short-subunit alcohol dehydrogenase family)